MEHQIKMATGSVSFIIQSFNNGAAGNTISVQFLLYETCKSTYFLAMQGAVTSKHAPSLKSIVKGGQSR